MWISFSQGYCPDTPPPAIFDNVSDRVDQLVELDPTQIAVLLVDFQNDFCAAPTGTVNNVITARRANAFAASASAGGMRVIYSQQIYDPGRLTPRQQRWNADSPLCVAGTTGADLFVPPVAGARVARKDRYDIWSSAEFEAILEGWSIDGLIIGGVELQCCVLYAVLGADERGYHYAVPQDLVSGIDECDETSNRAVRDYLSFAHPSLATASELLELLKRR